MRWELATSVLQGTNAGGIHQSLETLGELREVNRYIRMCLDKLGIKGDLV